MVHIIFHIILGIDLGHTSSIFTGQNPEPHFIFEIFIELCHGTERGINMIEIFNKIIAIFELLKQEIVENGIARPIFVDQIDRLIDMIESLKPEIEKRNIMQPTQDEIDAVRFAMKHAHPDNGGNDDDFERFKAVYDRLTRR